MESAITAPVSGHVKRVLVQEGELERYPRWSKDIDCGECRRLHQPRRPYRRDCSLKIIVCVYD